MTLRITLADLNELDANSSTSSYLVRRENSDVVARTPKTEGVIEALRAGAFNYLTTRLSLSSCSKSRL